MTEIKITKSKIYNNKFDVLINSESILDLTFEDAKSYINFEVSKEFNLLTIEEVSEINIQL